MTFLLEDELDGPGRLWYDRAKEAYSTFGADKGKFMNQARLWLDEYDLGVAEIAWNLVAMEHENEDLG